MPATFAVTNPIHGLLGKPYGVSGFSSGSGVALGHNNSPFIAAYPWTDGVGFGTKHANPATLPVNAVFGVAFSGSGDTIFYGFQAAPFVHAYPFSRASGFGTKYADPATAVQTTVNAITCRSHIASANHHVATANVNNPPNQNVYRFSKTGVGWGTRFSNPATVPVGNCRCVAFSRDGAHLAYGTDASPFVTAYPWTDSGYGTKYANPGTLPAANIIGVKFSPLGGALAISQLSNPEPAAAWAFATGFGTKYAVPALPVGWGAVTGDGGIGFNRPGTSVAIGHSFNGTVGGFTAWNWDDATGFGSLYVKINPVPGGLGTTPSFNEKSTTIFGGLAPSPFIIAKRFNSSAGFGTSYSNPGVLPAGAGNCIAVAS